MEITQTERKKGRTDEMTKKRTYPATFTPDGEYLFVEFPDIEGAFTQGENWKEAYEMAEEVLGIVLAEMTEYPAPSSVEDIAARNPQATVALVSVAVAE